MIIEFEEIRTARFEISDENFEELKEIINKEYCTPLDNFSFEEGLEYLISENGVYDFADYYNCEIIKENIDTKIRVAEKASL